VRETVVIVFCATGVLGVAIIASQSKSYAQLAESVWPVFRHDLRHTGQSSVDTSANPGTLKWILGTADQPQPSAAIGVSSSPAIGSDGTIYVGADDSLLAVNADGTIKWGFVTGSVIENSSPAIASDGTIYIGSSNGNLYALTDGGQGLVAEKWAFATSGVVGTSPTIGTDGTIYFGSHDNNLYAVNPDGTLKWKFPTDDSIQQSSAAIGSDGTIYVGSFDKMLYAVIDGGQGKVTKKWTFLTGASITSSPSIGSDGTIYIGSEDGNLYALADGGIGNVTEKWHFAIGGAVFSSPAIGPDGTVYVGSNTGLYALTDEGSTASQKWSLAIGSVASSPAIGADGTIFIGSENNSIYAVSDNGNNGSEKWVLETGFSVLSSPAIAGDGTIYIGSGDDNLYAIGVTDPAVSVKLKTSTKSLNFGTVKTGTITRPRYIRIANPKAGKKNLKAVSVLIKGSQLNPAFIPFKVIDACAPSLQAGELCWFGVQFAPITSGARNGTLMIFDNTNQSPQIIKLRGKGR